MISLASKKKLCFKIEIFIFCFSTNRYGLGATFGGDIIAGVMSAPEINSLSSTPPRPRIIWLFFFFVQFFVFFKKNILHFLVNVNDLNQESSQSSIDFVPLDVNHSESLGGMFTFDINTNKL